MKMGAGATTPGRSARQWAGIVEQWRRSHQPTGEFCHARGLMVRTFQWWRWALSTQRRHPGSASQRPQDDNSQSRSSSAVVPTPQASVPAFIEVVQRVASPAMPDRRPAGVEVVLPGARGERRVRVDAAFDAATFRRVVSLLEEV